MTIEIPDELRNAVIFLKTMYGTALNSPYVKNKVAWAIYQTWKQVDSRRGEYAEAK